MVKENGKTQEVTEGCQERIPPLERARLESIPLSGSINGTEQISVSSSNCTGENISRTDKPVRDSTAGKILERLDSLESKTLEYIDAHQGRLKARLSESEQAKKQFLEESHQIRSDIHHVATQHSEKENHSIQ
ncbi:hypothetical protein PN456_15315 [Nodularia spumigena CS-586/05]|uniref:hypothetical protein n=1 Tax=Nodularia spumigena TaxID=70799 RepID=UPI00232B9E1D|nr:hypothetical protein [Nodularia spumigena]MDB9370306.1 hypothetical protein [Nodularia spumigena CS-586/05]